MNVLFITCSRIGDAVLTTPILENINKLYPNSRVTIAADSLVAPLFKDFPNLEQIINFNKEAYSLHWLKLWAATLHKSWDWIIDLRGSIVSYGLFSKKRSIWRPLPNDPRHKVIQVCETAGVDPQRTHVWVSLERLKKAKEIIKTPTFAIAPAANWIGKQWPIERFVYVVREFLNVYSDASIAIFCAPHEQESIKEILTIFPERTYTFVNGEQDLCDVAALLQCCRLFMGNDSGLMHMSAAVGTPTIGLFGPSRENNYGPWQYPAFPPKHLTLRCGVSYEELTQYPNFSNKSQSCYMTHIQEDEVLSHVLEMWGRLFHMNEPAFYV